MKKYTHLVFDIDGTLMDSARVTLLSLQEAVRDVKGAEYPLEELKFGFGLPGVRTMEILGCDDPVYAQQRWMYFHKIYSERLGIPLFDGIAEVIDELDAAGVALGIITSKEREEYERQFTDNGLIDYFPCVITADMTKRGKPYPDPMLEYLRMTGASKDEVLYFGDTAYDMQCAASSGVDGALALWGCLDPDGVDAVYRVESVEDIPGFAAGAR